MSSKKQESIKIPSVEDLHDIGQGLVQMYQAGFLDGYRTDNPKANFNKKIMEKCRKSFEFRFVNELQGKIKLKNGTGKKQRDIKN